MKKLIITLLLIIALTIGASEDKEETKLEFKGLIEVKTISFIFLSQI